MEWKSCPSQIYLDGTPVECGLELGHAGMHRQESVEDCCPGGKEIKRPGADVLVVWVERP